MLCRGSGTTSLNRIPGTVAISGTAPGFYLRRKATRPDLHDPLSNKFTAKASKIAEAWKNTLTSAQRTAWTTYATAHPAKKHSGRTVTFNGFQYFSRINHTRLTLAAGLRLTPPPSGFTWEAPLINVDLSFPGLALFQFDNTANWISQNGAVAIVVDAGPANVGRRIWKRFGRLTATFAGGIPGGYPTPLVAQRLFGAFSTGGTLYTYVGFIS